MKIFSKEPKGSAVPGRLELLFWGIFFGASIIRVGNSYFTYGAISLIVVSLIIFYLVKYRKV